MRGDGTPDGTKISYNDSGGGVNRNVPAKTVLKQIERAYIAHGWQGANIAFW